MAKNQTLDMTRGNPMPLLIRFAIPLILGSLFQQLYSFVDTAIVGRCIGSDALTAVGVTGSLNFLVLGFTMGSAMGFCIPISQAVYCAAAWAVLFVLKKPAVYLLLGEVTSPEALASVEYLSIITTLFICHGSLMIFRNTVQGMGFGMSALASSVMEIIGRSAAGLLAVHFSSFFLICVSAPMAWALACVCCIGLCAYYIPKKNREFATQ